MGTHRDVEKNYRSPESRENKRERGSPAAARVTAALEQEASVAAVAAVAAAKVYSPSTHTHTHTYPRTAAEPEKGASVGPYTLLSLTLSRSTRGPFRCGRYAAGSKFCLMLLLGTSLPPT